MTVFNGGEIWPKGINQTFRWNTTNFGYNDGVDISLVQVCTAQICPMIMYPNLYVANGVSASQGSYVWNVDQVRQENGVCAGLYSGSCQTQTTSSINPGTYKAYICKSGTGICDTSDSYFTITAANTSNLPDINIVSPNGGETWRIGTTQTVSVNLTGDTTKMGDNIKIYLAPDSWPTNKILIATVQSGLADGVKSYQVNVPQTIGIGTYKIYVELYSFSWSRWSCPAGYSCLPPNDSMIAYDYSDNSFAITQ